MTENIKRINNPLTIIAIFAALAEVSATVAIGLIDKDLHYIFIWFVIGFPSLLVILFFVTLNFNTKVMYSPSDYKDDKSFMDSIFGNAYGGKKNDDSIIDAEKLEEKIIEKIQPKLNELESKDNLADIKREIGLIKKELKEATDKSIKEIAGSAILSPEVKNALLNLYRFPAFYLIIYAIVNSSSKNVNQLRNFSKSFYMPGSWDRLGLNRLLKEKILTGDKEQFSINSLYENELKLWVNHNRETLLKISFEYKKEESKDEIETTDKQITMNEIRRIAEDLKF